MTKKKYGAFRRSCWLLLLLPCCAAVAQLPPGANGGTLTGAPLPYADYYTVRGGLDAFYTAVTRDKKATVGFLGGSITYNPGWRDKVCAWLQTRFPGTEFRFIAAGIPSLGSLPHAFRVQQDLLDSGRIDLMFLEAAVNDRVNGTDSLSQLRSLEGIVRHIKKTGPETNIVLMAFADSGKTGDYDRGVIPTEVANQELVAAHYRLPSINFAREVREKIRHGEFGWKKDFKDLHPAPFGQELYFENIRQLLDSCWETYSKGTLPPGSEALPPGSGASGALPSGPEALPAPLDSANLECGRYADIRLARTDKAWTLYPDWTPGDTAKTRPGFVHVPVLGAETPGAELSLSFRGTAVGMAVVSGPDAGMVAYSIDGGAFRSLDLYTQWSRRLHLPWYVLLGSALPDVPHTLRLRISGEKNPQSLGHACRIVHFLINRAVPSPPSKVSKSADTLVVAAGQATIVFDRATGKVNYRFANGVILDNTVASVADLHRGHLSTADCSRHRCRIDSIADRWGRGKRITLEHWGNSAGLILVQHIRWYARQPYLLIDLEVRAAEPGGPQPETRDISPLAIVPATQGRLCVPGSEPRILGIPFDNDDWVNDTERRWPSQGGALVDGISYELMAVYDNTRLSGIVMGSVSHDFWKTGIAYRAAGVSGVVDSLKLFGGVATADDPARPADYGGKDGTHDHALHGTMTGAIVRSPLIYIAAAADVRRAFTDYGEMNARLNGRLSWKGGAPVYWNSFGVEDVLGASHRMMPPDVKQISDSLQSLHHFNQYSKPVLSIDSYDQGIYSTAVLDSISRYGSVRGQTMGFYFIPFSAWTWKDAIDHDELAGTHYPLRDVVLKDSSGRPIQYKEGHFGAYALDPTHPAVRESIIGQLQKARAIHARFLKIDFLTAGALESPAHYDPSVRSGIQAYNRGMRMLKRLIDSILGPEIFITQAISPLFPSQYAHTRFVSTDVYSHLRNDEPGFPDWGSTEASLATGSHMWWVQGTLWPFTNLDVIIMTHFQRNPELSEKEVKVRLYALMVMGSILGDGSDLRDSLAMRRARKFLDNARVDAFFSHPRAFTPLRWADGDSMDQQLAFYRKGDEATLVGLFNFSRKEVFPFALNPEELGLKPGNYLLKDLMTGQVIATIRKGQAPLLLTVPQEDADMIEIVPAPRK